MLLQSESISKFLSPCTHYVIINEPNPDMDFWYRWLSEYYINHKLVLLERIPYNYHDLLINKTCNEEFAGWVVQQLQKLLIAYHLNGDYLILDSKNFFIKQTDLSEWDDVLGNPLTRESHLDNYEQSYYRYRKMLKCENKEKSYGLLTPFKIEKKYITDNENFDFYTLGNILLDENIEYDPSEFLFYSMLVPDEHQSFSDNRNRGPSVYSLWGHEELNFDIDAFNDFHQKTKDMDVKIASFHRYFLSKASKVFFTLMNAKLKHMGFNNTLLPVARPV